MTANRGLRRAQAELLCQIVAGSRDAVMDFRVVPERPDRKAEVLEMQRAGRPVRFNFRGTLPALFDTLDRTNRAGSAVYFIANKTDGQGRRLANMVEARVVVLDLDGSPLPSRWAVHPHIIVNTSPNKFQCLWAINPTTDFTRCRDVNLRLAYFYDGDRSVADITRVLRVPGFWHAKKKPFRSRIVYAVDPAELEFGGRYELSDFDFLPKLPKPRRSKRKLSSSTVSRDLAAQYFDHLPANEFGHGHYDAWLRVGMAMHFATGGEALTEWLAWCASDPDFDNVDAQETAAAKWDGFSLDRVGSVTIGTLVHYGDLHDVPEHILGEIKFGKIGAADDFADDLLLVKAQS